MLLLMSGSSVAIVQAAHSIISIKNDGSGRLQVTCSGPHGLHVNDQINIHGTTGATYDGNNFTVTTIVSPSVFQFTDIAYSIDSTGGTWVKS